MKKIALAIDFSDVVPSLLKQAAELVLPLKAELHLLHVVELMPAYGMYGFSPEDIPMVGADYSEINSAAKSRLEDIAKITREMGITTHAAILEGGILEEILEYTEDNDMDMLMVGSHGHGFIASVLLGSVAEGAARRSKIPTLIIPTTKK